VNDRDEGIEDELSIVDSDAHVIEPHSVWTEYLEPRFRDRAPRPVGLTFGFEFEGQTVNLPHQWDPAMSQHELARRAERVQATYEELFPDAYAKGFSAEAQLADMDKEGIEVAFLYPSFGLFVLAFDGLDPQLSAAVARAYNNWLSDFCRTEPHRLHGVAMLPLQDPELAAAEAARCAEDLGFGAVFVRPNPVNGRNFDDPALDPLWETMSSLGMALGIHEGGFPRLPQVVNGRLADSEQRHICTHPMEQMIAAVSLIYGGVLERFPGLRVAFLEAGCGWVPFWLHRMDEHWDNSVRRDFGAARSLTMPPSQYFHRQCYVSADPDEYMLGEVIELIGDDRIVFSTDYPHPDSPWPQAVSSFLKLSGVSSRSKRKILWDNAQALYAVNLAPT
jgi:predicted TIM-barrel fold metal-dependent hydrolase